jgi:GntR family transcriptional regulator
MKFHPLNRSDAVPLYVQVANIIKKNIHNGELPPGAPIPSESQLMKAYDISRITVRNALLRLEYNGEIFKVHGRGSFVSTKKLIDIPSPSSSWRRLMEEQGHNISYELIELCEVWPTEAVKRELQLEKDGKAVKLKRLKKISLETIGLDVMFMPTKVGMAIKDLELNDFSMVKFLNASHETKIHRIDSQIRAAPIEDGDADVMGVDPSNTCLIRGFVAYNALDEPLLSGKIMYLSQYALVKVSVNVDAAAREISLVDAPASSLAKGSNLS